MTSNDLPSTPPGPIARVPRPKTDARDWYDALSDWYDIVADPFEAPARSVGLDVLEATPGERVLDVGCGTGSALLELSRAVAPDGLAIGLDLAPGMCQTARDRLTAADLEPDIVQGDGATLPFADGVFDALFASFVLELFDTPAVRPVLSEWSRVLASDGRLCIVSLSRRRAGPVTWLYEAVHERLPTHVDCRPIYLRETLLEAGFVVHDHREISAWGLPVEVVHCEIP
ncbi:class I SAM-dependent methyltransferase [Halostagnicola bangensis]